MDPSLEAVVFDLDGVITLTARLHATAWKWAFDRILREREGDDFRPFDVHEDYVRYVDGRPRIDGVATFLESRGILLPLGEPSDRPSLCSAWGIGNLKNDRFLELLNEEGADVDKGTVALIHELRDRGIHVAVASSSKNCESILRRAGLLNLFEARVDGVESARLSLQGKPHPDIFLEAARRLGVSPQDTVVVEDATAGVKAGREGGFGLVVGLDRHGERAALRSYGADVVLESLGADTVELFQRWMTNWADRRPSAWLAWPSLSGKLASSKSLAVFLDYDGTLTPIAPRPEDAVLSESMRATLKQLASRIPTAIISGRGVEDVRALLRVDGLYIAGAHGFQIVSPDGTVKEMDARWREMIEDAADDLEPIVRELPEAILERKGYSVAVHYRMVPPQRVPWLQGQVRAVAASYPELRRTPGKMVFELQPNIDWDKGAALCWLLEELGQADAMPIYIGDDITDEDAFAAVKGGGIGILVGNTPRKTVAEYSLLAPWEVELFLRAIGKER